MSNYDVAYPPVQSPQPKKVKKLGAALLGGLAGMTAYYIPVTKNNFVDEAFKVHRRYITNDINGLKQAAGELSQSTPNLSNESKLLLNKLGVSHDIDDVFQKSKDLEFEITDSSSVKNIKNSFANGFDTFKKNASTMDNIASEAMSNIKWRNFKWGMGIGAALTLALSCIFQKDS